MAKRCIAERSQDIGLFLTGSQCIYNRDRSKYQSDTYVLSWSWSEYMAVSLYITCQSPISDLWEAQFGYQFVLLDQMNIIEKQCMQICTLDPV